MSKYKVALDAGHGGSDPGAVYNGRQEKDDTLDLTLAVGDILKKNGIDVFYTRTNDEYETPFKKATDANNSGADLFVSIHRNSSEKPNQYSGVETLVYNDSGLKSEVARNINSLRMLDLRIWELIPGKILWYLRELRCQLSLLKQAL